MSPGAERPVRTGPPATQALAGLVSSPHGHRRSWLCGSRFILGQDRPCQESARAARKERLMFSLCIYLCEIVTWERCGCLEGECWQVLRKAGPWANGCILLEDT